MFNLIRRISGSVIPRPDRPWDEDATSNAPKVGRKRRLSTEGDKDDTMREQSISKRSRGATPQTSTTVESGSDEAEAAEAPTVSSQTEAEGVKEVTKGVKEVDLKDKVVVEETETGEGKAKEAAVAPESVPLPEDDSGEFEDSASIASTPPAASAEEEETDLKEDFNEEPSGSKPAAESAVEGKSSVKPEDKPEDSSAVKGSEKDSPLPKHPPAVESPKIVSEQPAKSDDSVP